MDPLVAARMTTKPVPPSLARFRRLLSGGDRRSIAGVERARALVAGPRDVACVAALAADVDALVAMRAFDLLEKLAHDRPEWVKPHKELFLGRLAASEAWEIRLQIVRALPLLDLHGSDRARAIEILKANIDHPQRFVRAWAADSLATFASDVPALRSTVERAVDAMERSDSSALRARAKQIRRRMAT